MDALTKKRETKPQEFSNLFSLPIETFTTYEVGFSNERHQMYHVFVFKMSGLSLLDIRDAKKSLIITNSTYPYISQNKFS
jgi:hypothetical protein